MTELGPVTVFVVEDQVALLKQLLKSLSLYPELTVVGTSQDGEEALREIGRVAPQLVLLDLELPSMDGIEVTRRLKLRGLATEVLILTSFDDEQKVYEAIQAGASGYLVKRVGPERIRDGIHQVMAGGTVLEPQIARRFWSYFQSLQGRPPAPPAPSPATPPSASDWGLSATELDVLQYVAKGLTNAQVGKVMELERRTIRTHLTHIYEKMGVHSHVEAVVKALGSGLIQL